MKTISLTQGNVALVDDEDFDALKVFKWFLNPARQTLYAKRMLVQKGDVRHTEYMHRAVLARKIGRLLINGETVDHINGNGLDNRRENLRLATYAQNGSNRVHRLKDTSSIFLGVTWHRLGRKWMAQIVANGNRVYLGLHGSELEAALAREAYIDAYPELQARSNFVGADWLKRNAIPRSAIENQPRGEPTT